MKNLYESKLKFEGNLDLEFLNGNSRVVCYSRREKKHKKVLIVTVLLYDN